MYELKICTGCMWRKETGLLHVDLPPDHNCIHFDACSRAYNIGVKDMREVANNGADVSRGRTPIPG